MAANQVTTRLHACEMLKDTVSVRSASHSNRVMHVAHWFPGIFARGAHLLEIAWRNLATTTIKDPSSTKPFCPNFSFFFTLALDWITRELAGNVLLV